MYQITITQLPAFTARPVSEWMIGLNIARNPTLDEQTNTVVGDWMQEVSLDRDLFELLGTIRDMLNRHLPIEQRSTFRIIIEYK